MEASEEKVAAEVENQDHPGVLAPPPLIFTIPLLVGLLIDWRLSIVSISVAVPVRVPIGAVFGLLGGTIGLWGVRTMRRARTSPSPRMAPRALVTSGPFAFSRNPLYVALTLIYVGIAISLNAVVTLALLGVVFLVLRQGVVLREERYLERKFGDEYRTYKARVRRWV